MSVFAVAVSEPEKTQSPEEHVVAAAVAGAAKEQQARLITCALI